MKKLFFVCFLVWCVPVLLFAQSAKIVEVKGEAYVKQNAQAAWEKAKVNMSLEKGAQVKTTIGGQCMVAFDAARKNLLSVKSNSQITIENVTPGNIYLPEGRVFVLIGSVPKNEKFQVRTPTAIAGARGTGWGEEVQDKKTELSCFEDAIFVQGLDASGNPTGEQDLNEGFGMGVGEGGVFGEMTPLNDTDRNEWNDFSNQAGNASGAGATGTDESANDMVTGSDNTDTLGDSKDEARDDYKDVQDQDRREAPEQPETPGPCGGVGTECP